MNRTSFRRVAAPSAAVLVLGLALSACGAANESDSGTDSGSDSSSSLSGTLNGAGSSAQEAAMAAWRSAFQSKNPDVTVNYDPVGSGGGREQFLAGGVAFAGSDSYLSDEELASSKKVCGGTEAFDVPSYVSPIAVVYNLDGVDGLQLSPATLGKIFAGTITTWDDAAIKAENPDATLPSTKITPVHRSDDSGTTKNFTDYLFQASGGSWKNEADGLWPLKSGEGANGTSGVIEAVTNGKGSIGYADESQAGDLSIASIKVGDAYVAPSAEAAAKTLEVSKPAEGRPSGDIAIDVDRTTTEAGAYPLILVSYVVACPSYDDAATGKLVKEFLTYVVSADGQQAAASAAGSAPLPSSLSDQGTTQLATIGS